MIQSARQWKSTSLIASCFISIAVATSACSSLAQELVEAATERLRSDLEYLASDELEGRDVGSEGIAKAGEFIAQRFVELGLDAESFDGTAFQEFSLPGQSELGAPEHNTLAFVGADGLPTPVLGQNFMSLSLGSSASFDGELVFAGYGITAPDLGYDDYAGLDVKDKVVIVLRKEPQQEDENSIFQGRGNSQYAYFTAKEANASLHGVAAMILVNDSLTAGRSDSVMDINSAGDALTSQQVPTIFCQRSLIDPIIQQALGKSLSELERDIDQDLVPQSQLLPEITASGQTEIKQARIPVRNVIGLLPGAGDLKNEFVVVGAHYDHVGMGGQGSLAPGTVAIHNGADDNASGTVTMLEVARRMASDATEHRRSLLFMAFTAEEKGLLGSKHYVRSPRWPLEDTVAMVNMDMVGRLRENELTVYGTGTAKGFSELIDGLNEEYQFLVNKVSAGYGPSDHASFYQADIPVFHFFTGLHNEYHRPNDDPVTVNFEGMERVASMITATVRDLATRAERPEHIRSNAVANIGFGPRRRAPRAVLGIEIDLEFEGSGVRVASVPEGSPADLAGLQAQDIIVRLDDANMDGIRDLRMTMSQKKPSDVVRVVLMRKDVEVEVSVTLGEGQ